MTYRPLRITLLLLGTMLVMFNSNGCTIARGTVDEKNVLGAGDEVQFRATVVSINYLSRYSGRIQFADFDAQFVLTLDVHSTTPSDCEPELGRQIFAIHSPTHVFVASGALGNDPKGDVTRPELWGKTFDFTMSRGKYGWILLRAKGLEDSSSN
jgi:hypothetical protein